MAIVRLYNFSIYRIEIEQIRSPHSDTLYISAVVSVAGRDPVKVTRYLGDRGRGTFDPVIVLQNVAVADNETAVFTYAVVNAGHANRADVERALTGAATLVANAGANAAGQAVAAGAGAAAGAAIGAILGSSVPVLGTIVGSALGSFATSLLVNLWNIIIADCDGPVAAAANLVDGAQLYENCSRGRFISHRDDNPGIDSPAGCGANSHYHTNWSVRDALVSIAVVAWSQGRLDVFGLGTDSHCDHKWWDGNN